MITQTVDELPIEQVPATSRRRLQRSYWLGASRPVVIVHALCLVAGLAVLLHENAHLWFFGDDWEFIVNRGLHHPIHSIWQPHNEHWSTLPILWYRLLFTLFGLHYFPYILSAIVAHLVLAHLLWRTCLREGVDPWIATTFAALFIFFGAGAENLTWAFQITFISSLVFGYLALEVARRPESLRVDVAVSLLLLCALMCSTVGDAMLVAVALFLVLSRGWRRGLRPVVFPFGCYVVWYGLVGHNSVTSDHLTFTSILSAPAFVWSGLQAALGSTFGLSAAGGALLVGLLAWTAYDFPKLYRAHPAVLGLGLGSGVFYLLVALGRSGAGGTSAASRYFYVAMALLIPLIATLTSLVKRPAFDIRVPVIAILLIVLVTNLGALRTFARNRLTLVEPLKQQILTTASLVAQGVPSLTPAPVPYTPDLTTSAMRDFVHSGRLGIVPVSPSQRLQDEAAMDIVASSTPLTSRSLGISSANDVALSAASDSCTAAQATGPTPQVELKAAHSGGSIELEGPANAVIGVSAVQGKMIVPAAPITLNPLGRAFVNSELRDGNVFVALPPGTTLLCSVT